MDQQLRVVCPQDTTAACNAHVCSGRSEVSYLLFSSHELGSIIASHFRCLLLSHGHVGYMLALTMYPYHPSLTLNICWWALDFSSLPHTIVVAYCQISNYGQLEGRDHRSRTSKTGQHTRNERFEGSSTGHAGTRCLSSIALLSERNLVLRRLQRFVLPVPFPQSWPSRRTFSSAVR